MRTSGKVVDASQLDAAASRASSAPSVKDGSDRSSLGNKAVQRKSSLSLPLGSTLFIRPKDIADPIILSSREPSILAAPITHMRKLSSYLNLSIFALTCLLSCSLCFLPLIGDTVESSVIFSQSPLQSNSLLLSAVAVISFGISLVPDLLLDFALKQTVWGDWVPYAVLVVTSTLPAFVVISQPKDHSFDGVFVCLLSMEVVAWTGACLAILHTFAPDRFTLPAMFTTFLLLAASYACSLSTLFFASTAGYVLALLFFLGFLCVFTVLLARAVLDIYRKHAMKVYSLLTWTSVLTLEDYACVVTVVACFFLIYAAFTVTYAHSSIAVSPAMFDADQCAVFLVLFSAFLLVLSSVTHRCTRLRAIRLQNDLEIKRNFVRYVGHEVRTPLNTIAMGLDLVRRELDGIPACAESLDTIALLQESCGIAVEILNELLLFEKIESGIMALDVEVVLPKPFLEATLRPFQLAARSKAITMEVLLEDPTVAIIASTSGNIAEVMAAAGGGGTAAGKVWGVEIDEGKMAQVVRNFVSNALKFTPTGGRVTVSMRYVKNAQLMASELKDVLRLEVKDSGHGIAPENQHKVFNEIVQFHANKHQGGGGSGLGLWISRKIVELHGGKVGLFSKGEGRGCTFVLELPLHEVVEAARDEDDDEEEDFGSPLPPRFVISSRASHSKSSSYYSDHARSPFTDFDLAMQTVEEPAASADSCDDDDTARIDLAPSSTLHTLATTSTTAGVGGAGGGMRYDDLQSKKSSAGGASQRGYRILVVDDSALNRKVMMRSLEAAGHTCVQAADGLDAVNAFASNSAELSRIDMVLMDNLMPNLSGEQATQRIRALGYHGYIIGVTGNGLPADIASFKEHGANDVIVKPMSVEKLDEVLAKLQQKKRLQQKQSHYVSVKSMSMKKSAISMKQSAFGIL